MISKPDYIAGAILVVEAFIKHHPPPYSYRHSLKLALNSLKKGDGRQAYIESPDNIDAVDDAAYAAYMGETSEYHELADSHAKRAITSLHHSDLPFPIRQELITQYILLTQ